MKDTLQYILNCIVENPKKVKIEETEENGIISLNVSAAKEDMGKIIGKKGKIIKAIRNVMKISAIKQDKRLDITLAESTE